MDPLAALPAEVVLRILLFASFGSIASLTRSSRSWCNFIDFTHQDAIYAAKAPGTTGAMKLREPGQYLNGLESFTRYGEGVESWKEACRRRILLEKSWSDERPSPKETVIQVGTSPIWRFRPDFKRRFIVSTSHAGGLNVTDMDSGDLLWSLPRDEVRRFAHLEYQDGTAVWDRFRNTLEVWKTDLPGLARGHFRQVALLPHDVITRGFQLSYNTLCVVSSEGEGFVYDFLPHPEKPRLRKRVEIEDGAVGHLDQDTDAVMYSIGTHDYHIHDKTSGDPLGHIHPHMVKPSAIYHIRHPQPDLADEDEYMSLLPDSTRYLLARMVPELGLSCLPIHPGLFFYDDSEALPDITPLERDEWGAGMLNGKTMVGVSRGGRLVICADWPQALRSEEDFASVTSIVECDPGGDSFDLGGWLHIHDTVGGKRIIFEVKDSVYILSLDGEGRLDVNRPALSVPTCSTPELAVPVSFMGIYDDCIMSTFTTLGTDPVDETSDDDDSDAAENGRALARHFPTKAIRAISFAPEI
ncbi:Uu.00g115350.m01.CDS01 [Anthostomella pinea]|uniref:Uu.00g115350.m01.CDS01 n=1 Tax=Anthostomella pinea TaxID=933095 RepID=A0AAI8YGR4_9PEZI|nr:Uu.00g115350.m01.CDS01 [Anthostomella pinea]